MKFFLNGKWHNICVEQDKNKYIVTFPYSPDLVNEIKESFYHPRWNGEERHWTMPICERNIFRFAFYEQGAKIYDRWDKKDEVKMCLPETHEYQGSKVEIYKHQLMLARSALATRADIWAAEMGTGKSLAAQLVIEHSKAKKVWWIGPKPAVEAVKLELRKWNCKIPITLLTYEQMISTIARWEHGKAPSIVIFDEASRLKNWTAKRTESANFLAQAVRKEHPEHGIIIAMSGSPAPNDPTDWWSICEIVRPGYLREGGVKPFLKRLAITKLAEGVAGGTYFKKVAWRSSDNICDVCGEGKEHVNHTLPKTATVQQIFASFNTPTANVHDFVQAKNEVYNLYQRMKGLTTVLFKKDCLDLPPKIYQRRYCQVSDDLKKAYKMLKSSCKSALDFLIRARELSDGFQYKDVKEGITICPFCLGKKFFLEDGLKISCKGCKGEGQVASNIRQTQIVECPKDELLTEIMEEIEDTGRLIVYGGFTATVNRIQDIVSKQKWHLIRVDGRGWTCSINPEFQPEDMLTVFQERQKDYPKIVFIGHPASAGMGLTLTAAQYTVYYSNDFNAESRIQSEARTHRPSSKGTTIIDLINLPSDELVLNKLIDKRTLQNITMGELEMALASVEVFRD